MSKKRTKEGPDAMQPRFEIGERVLIVPESPLARHIALMIAAARQRAGRAIFPSPDRDEGGSN